MKVRKIIALLISMVLVLSMMSGCGEKETTSKSAETNKDASTKEEIGMKDSEGDVSVVGKIGDGETTFSFWLPMHVNTSKMYESHNEHPYAEKLAERTGVRPQYINPTVGNEKAQLNLILSSFDLPDAIQFDLSTFYRGGVDGAIADGILIDMTKLIEENAPNFMAEINADENVRRDSYTDDGSIKTFGAIIPDPEMRGLPFQGPMINKAFLDETGLDIPVTIADWEEVLTAFQANGVAIPFSWGANNTLDGMFDAFASAYGVPTGSTFYQEDGNVKYGPVQEGYREFLTLMNSWYEKGLLDPDYISRNSNKDLKTMLGNSEIGATIAHLGSIRNLKEDNAALGIEFDLVAAPYPVLNEGDTVHLRQHAPNIKPEGVFVTTAAKDPETIIKWIDYRYGEEGKEFIYWGEEGVTFNRTDDGKVFTDLILNNPDGIARGNAYRQILMRDLNTYWDWSDQYDFYSEPAQRDAWDVWKQADYANELPSSLMLTVEESEEFSAVMSDIDTYVQEMATKFIMGIEPLDNYDAFVETINGMDIEKAIACKQAALERYQDR